MQVYQFVLWRDSLLVTMIPLDWKQICTFTSQNKNSLKSLSHPILTADTEMKRPCLCASEMFLPQQAASHHLPLGPKGQSVPNGLRSLSVILQTCKEKEKKEAIDTKCLAWWEERRLGQNFHLFTLLCMKISVLSSSRVVWGFEVESWFFIGLVIGAMKASFGFSW